MHHCAIFSRKEAEKETTIDMVWLASFAPKIATIASQNGMSEVDRDCTGELGGIDTRGKLGTGENWEPFFWKTPQTEIALQV